MNIKTSNRIIMVLYVIVLFLLSIQVGKYYNKFVNKKNNDDFVIKYDYKDNSRIVSDINNNDYQYIKKIISNNKYIDKFTLDYLK